jgi:hypothetical protein
VDPYSVSCQDESLRRLRELVAPQIFEDLVTKRKEDISALEQQDYSKYDKKIKKIIKEMPPLSELSSDLDKVQAAKLSEQCVAIRRYLDKMNRLSNASDHKEELTNLSKAVDAYRELIKGKYPALEFKGNHSFFSQSLPELSKQKSKKETLVRSQTDPFPEKDPGKHKHVKSASKTKK